MFFLNKKMYFLTEILFHLDTSILICYLQVSLYLIHPVVVFFYISKCCWWI